MPEPGWHSILRFFLFVSVYFLHLVRKYIKKET